MIRKALSVILLGSTFFATSSAQAHQSGYSVETAPAQIDALAPYSCKRWSDNGRATARCRVNKGKIRLVAKCGQGKNQYSGWYGRGYHKNIKTRKCRGGALVGSFIQHRNK